MDSTKKKCNNKSMKSEFMHIEQIAIYIYIYINRRPHLIPGPNLIPGLTLFLGKAAGGKPQRATHMVTWGETWALE